MLDQLDGVICRLSFTIRGYNEDGYRILRESIELVKLVLFRIEDE